MRIVRIAYRNLWAGGNDFSAEHIVECFPCLRGHYRFEISSDPQLVLYSVYGYHHSKVNESAIRVLYNGEAGDTYALGGKLPSELVPGGMQYRWGDVFNPASIINVDRFTNWEAAIEFIKLVDQNDELYQSFLDASAFVGNVVPERFKEETFLRFWREILQRIT